MEGAKCAPLPDSAPEDVRAMHALFFGDTMKAQNAAKALCWVCPVRMDCLRGAIERREPDGVWGGLTAKERKALRKRMR